MFREVFYNQERSGYEELISYGPYFYKDILEMDANYRFAGKTLDIMAEGLESIVANQFIDLADEDSILRWERWLDIETDFSRSLEDRRKKVKLVWNGGQKLTGSFIKSLVRSYTGCEDDPMVKMTTHLMINAYITSNKAVYLSDLYEQLEKMRPAHIRFVLSMINYSKIKIGRKLSHAVYSYDKAGEKPDIATLGARFAAPVGGITEFNASVYTHLPASDTHAAGTYPETSTLGSAVKDGISTEDTFLVSVSSYVECGTNTCGEEVL